jgi:hypothetical protein
VSVVRGPSSLLCNGGKLFPSNRAGIRPRISGEMALTKMSSGNCGHSSDATVLVCSRLQYSLQVVRQPDCERNDRQRRIGETGRRQGLDSRQGNE